MDLMTSTEYVYVILVLNDVFINYILLREKCSYAFWNIKPELDILYKKYSKRTETRSNNLRVVFLKCK